MESEEVRGNQKRTLGYQLRKGKEYTWELIRVDTNDETKKAS